MAAAESADQLLQAVAKFLRTQKESANPPWGYFMAEFRHQLSDINTFMAFARRRTQNINCLHC